MNHGWSANCELRSTDYQSVAWIDVECGGSTPFSMTRLDSSPLNHRPSGRFPLKRDGALATELQGVA
jgi:hypothetical protein